MVYGSPRPASSSTDSLFRVDTLYRVDMIRGCKNFRLAPIWGQVEELARTVHKTAEGAGARLSLVERTVWRKLTSEQQIEIGSRLSRFAGNTATLWYSAGDKKAETFAWEIAASLHWAKWRVYSPASLWTMFR